MHRCLSILELFENICEHVNSANQAQSTLAALARTCKGFTGPALNCLWAVQTHGMVNLMRCMPPDLFEFGDNREARLLRPILAADWERPLIYMRRIRCLYCSVPMAGVSELCASFPDDIGSLFPKLTSLHWNNWTSGDDPSILLLLSPRLTSLSVSARLSETMLPAIPRTCPALKNLDIYRCYHMNSSDRSALSSCLRDLHSLESVEVVISDMVALEHLSRLPCLTSLTTRLLANLPLPSMSLPFIALKALVIRYNIEQVTRFFQSCSGLPLNNVTIELDPCPTTAAMDKLHTALRQGCSHASLLSLAIEIQDDDPPDLGDDAYSAVNMESLRSFFCFVNITSLCIASCVGFSIDDQGLKELAITWPQIRELRLRLEPYYTDIHLHPQFSLRCLSILAEHCRALAALEITLDATVIPSDPDTISQSALCRLDAGKSPIASPAVNVARFISTLFSEHD
ncbi:hypothetical protein MSAN_01230400 [Mycena sanguinolenta]|uniref:Uncharacterized protein n=1 Tax=Mycena sanguinolenta TaxID=230812 RepID=A0A8H7D4S2_9AGAR|nr:hypothetical protein MSAN_01230400 [Mycena sanguinolenta]